VRQHLVSPLHCKPETASTKRRLETAFFTFPYSIYILFLTILIILFVIEMLYDTYVFMLALCREVEFCDAYVFIVDYAVSQFVESLCHKTEGRGFDSRWFH
jgi:hypothetical protein